MNYGFHGLFDKTLLITLMAILAINELNKALSNNSAGTLRDRTF